MIYAFAFVGAGTSYSLEKPNSVNPTTAGFSGMAHENLDQAKGLLQQVLAATGPRTIENTLEPANRMYTYLANSSEISSLMRNVHPDEAVRKAAEKAEQETSAFLAELGLNRELFEAVKAVDVSSADAATRHAVKKLLRDFRRDGVDQPGEVREKIKKIKDELVLISQEFGGNIRKDVRFIVLADKSELKGLPEDYINGHSPGEDGKIRITTDYPDYTPFMQYAESAEARKQLYTEFKNRGYPANLDVLDRLLAKRHELACLLGYKSWAQYITEDKMIKSDQAAAEFIDKIARISAERSAADMKALLERKRKDFPGAETVEEYESPYYENLVKSEQYQFDPQSVRPYFEFGRVRKGLFDLTARMFGIRYEQVDNVTAWRPDVTVWDVYDGDKKLGRFYLDLFPRENKYKHAACFGVCPGIEGLQDPQSALVCNFPDPSKTDGPALMEYKDVETFFHEFGHLLHAIFAGHQRWNNISGINTEWDFVEAPSQMLEEWVANHEVLKMFAKHYKTGEPIPEDLVAKMKKAKRFGQGIWVRHQMYYASISLQYYNRDPAGLDTTELQGRLMNRYSPYRFVDGTHIQCSFGHLDGYSAIYYTYMWSLTIAKDLFSRFEKEGLLDEKTARDYRNCILEPGGSKDAALLVKDFLGRDYSFDAYETWLNKGS